MISPAWLSSPRIAVCLTTTPACQPLPVLRSVAEHLHLPRVRPLDADRGPEATRDRGASSWEGEPPVRVFRPIIFRCCCRWSPPSASALGSAWYIFVCASWCAATAGPKAAASARVQDQFDADYTEGKGGVSHSPQTCGDGTPADHLHLLPALGHLRDAAEDRGRGGVRVNSAGAPWLSGRSPAPRRSGAIAEGSGPAVAALAAAGVSTGLIVADHGMPLDRGVDRSAAARLGFDHRPCVEDCRSMKARDDDGCANVEQARHPAERQGIRPLKSPGGGEGGGEGGGGEEREGGGERRRGGGRGGGDEEWRGRGVEEGYGSEGWEFESLRRTCVETVNGKRAG